MSRTIFAAAMASAAFAIKSQQVAINNDKVVYPDWVDREDVEVDQMDYQMIFRWPENRPRCTATMISD